MSFVRNKRLLSVLACGFVLIVGFLLLLVNRARADDGVERVDHLVAVYDRGAKRVIQTDAVTVEEVLNVMELELGEGDRVEPGLAEEVSADNFSVNVYRARPVLVVDGMSRKKILTAAQTNEDIAEEAGLELNDEDGLELRHAGDFIETGSNVELVVLRSKLVKLKFYGKDVEVRTLANTVGEFVAEKEISLEDYVSKRGNVVIEDGMKLEIWRNGKNLVVKEEAIKYKVEQTRDYDQPIGYKKVTKAGENGKKMVTYEVVMRNGKEVSKKLVDSVVVKESKVQKEVVGARAEGVYTSPSKNAKIIWDYLRAKGFSEVATAGIMGNLQQEHQFQTSGDGLAQWIGGRRENLLAFAKKKGKPYTDIYVQLDFLMSELNGGYAGVKANLMRAKTVENAVVIFQNQFEKCGICAEGQRIQYARNIYVTYRSKSEE